MEQLDLRQLMRIARRRAWIVILLMVISGSVAYYNSSRETKVYSASATMLITPGQTFGGSVDYNSLMVSQMLAETYPQLITNGDMYARVATALNMESIPGSISASAVADSQLIVVTVTDTDPKQAADVANAVVTEFPAYMAERTQQSASGDRALLDQQIEDLTTQLAGIDDEIGALEASSSAEDPAVQRQINDLSQERAATVGLIAELRVQAATVETNRIAASASVEPAGLAVEPTTPISPQPRQALLLGMFVGLMLGIGVVALLEFLDNTVKPEQNLHAVTGAPVLATISSLGKLQPGGPQVYTMAQPQSSATEALRLLRTNLEFAAASGPIGTLTITSPGPGEGKSTVTANIGVVMAQTGMNVVIVDADLRKPTQHRVFGIPNDRGLTSLLTHPEEDWRASATKVALPGLRLIPSGPLPPNPGDLVASARFAQLIDKIKTEVDLVVIDSPPILSASDALTIAARTDGAVLVCQSHKTRLDALRHAAHSVHHGGIRLVGIVLNRPRGQVGATYYGEYYGRRAAPGPGD